MSVLVGVGVVVAVAVAVDMPFPQQRCWGDLLLPLDLGLGERGLRTLEKLWLPSSLHKPLVVDLRGENVCPTLAVRDVSSWPTPECCVFICGELSCAKPRTMPRGSYT